MLAYMCDLAPACHVPAAELVLLGSVSLNGQRGPWLREAHQVVRMQACMLLWVLGHISFLVRRCMSRRLDWCCWAR